MDFMTDADALSVRTALRRALTGAMKRRDRAASNAYRIALAAIDNAEAVPLGEELPAGAIEQSPVGVGRTDAPRLILREPDMVHIVRREVQDLRAAADLLAERNPDAARRRRQEAWLLQAVLDQTCSD